MTGPRAAGPARSRRALFGVGDQVLSSGTNYLTAFVASFVLAPESFGGFVVAYAVVTVVAAATRAFLSEPLLAHLPTVASASRRAQLAGSALTASAVVGVVGSVLLSVLGLAGGVLATLLAFAPWLTGALVADAGRYVLLARSETGRTFAVDAAWALAQLGALVVVAATGAWSPATIAASWGIGALAAVATLAVVGVGRPRRPGEWLREGRYLSGWFTVVSVVGQVQMYAVLLIAGAVLATSEMAGLRAVQLLVYQPPTTFMAAVLVLATPMFARLAVRPDRAPFLRLRRSAVLAMGVLGLVVLAAIPLRHVLLDLLFPRYTDFAPLVAPLALQVVVGGLGVPFAASLRGMRRGRELFATQVVTALGLVVGAVVGLALGGVLGLAWGMAAGAVVSVGVEVVVAVRARPRPVAAGDLVEPAEVVA